MCVQSFHLIYVVVLGIVFQNEFFEYPKRLPLRFEKHTNGQTFSRCLDSLNEFASTATRNILRLEHESRVSSVSHELSHHVCEARHKNHRDYLMNANEDAQKTGRCVSQPVQENTWTHDTYVDIVTPGTAIFLEQNFSMQSYSQKSSTHTHYFIV